MTERDGGTRRRSDRVRLGKAIRARVPRSEQSRWVPPRDRRIVGLLRSSGRGRRAELLSTRYHRMAASPFAFLRGAASLMARDLSRTATTGLAVQMGGDAHLANFGIFATPERDRVFDVNDFDETLRGPFEWDLKRLATSVVLAGELLGTPARAGRKATAVALRAYRENIRRYAVSTYLDTWYAHLDLSSVGRLIDRPGRRRFRRELAQAEGRTGFHAFPRLVEQRGGRARIRDAPPLIRHFPDRREERLVRGLFEAFATTLPTERRPLLERYRLEDVAEKVVGVGSVGTRCAIGLFLGDRDLLDPLFLQVKQALPSVYEHWLGPSDVPNHAQRVVEGQRSIQQASDIFLGWGTAEGNDYYVRQLRDMKVSADIATLGRKALEGQAELCGAALARAHARTGDPAMIAGYLGAGDEFDEAIVGFAVSYARQTASDHAALRKAITDGRSRPAPDG